MKMGGFDHKLGTQVLINGVGMDEVIRKIPARASIILFKETRISLD